MTLQTLGFETPIAEKNKYSFIKYLLLIYLRYMISLLALQFILK